MTLLLNASSSAKTTTSTIDHGSSQVPKRNAFAHVFGVGSSSLSSRSQSAHKPGSSPAHPLPTVIVTYGSCIWDEYVQLMGYITLTLARGFACQFRGVANGFKKMCERHPQAEVHTNQFDKDVLCFNKFLHVTSWGMDQPW